MDPATRVSPDIRPAREEDVEALVQLTLEAFVPVFPSFERLLGPAIYHIIWPDWRAGQRKGVETLCRERDKHLVWVAELNGVPVGFIACDVNPQEHTGEVQLLAVHPRHQNRGVGTALNRFALERMKERGVRLARVETGGDPSHAPARRSYEKSGYVPLPLVRYFKDL
ncbi:GNAT family N-acetyltransferase [candidate division WOR-3 bacterium]|nr:GNAT family N-acetyltransferase [candidate division WOR-3 bacterium]